MVLADRHPFRGKTCPNLDRPLFEDEVSGHNLARERDGELTPLDVTASRARVADQQQGKKAVLLVLIGAITGFLGFFLSTLIGVYRFWFSPLKTNFLGQDYPSGYNYVPQTLSELNHDVGTAEGKVFNSFCTIAALCMFASWYPYQLRNVYVGVDEPVLNIRFLKDFSWPTLRHFAPPIGMLLVTMIPVPGPANREFPDQIAVACHNIGATAMIGAYGLTELQCLLGGGTKKSEALFKPREWYVRFALVALSLASAGIFTVNGIIAKQTRNWECGDVWMVPTADHLQQLRENPALLGLQAKVAEAIRTKTQLLFNTAQGVCVTIKLAEFWFEAFAGLFMISNLLVIWWFCPERHVPVDDQLPPLSKTFLRAQGYEDEYVLSAFGFDSGSLQNENERFLAKSTLGDNHAEAEKDEDSEESLTSDSHP